MNTISIERMALEAVGRTAVAVFAYRDGRGRPMAWPVTPYIDGEKIVVTSTLAYIRKAQHVRRDGRVALLADGLHVMGRASVQADASGNVFVAKLLEQELRKYPPARQIMRFPARRQLFSWYFGRVIMTFEPLDVREVPGDDRCTLIAVDESGFPRITPIDEPPASASAFTPLPLGETNNVSIPDGASTVLYHLEPTMSDLRQEVLRGEIRDGTFSVQTRIGTLAAPPRAGWLDQLRGQLELHRRGRKSRKVIRDWDIAQVPEHTKS